MSRLGFSPRGSMHTKGRLEHFHESGCLSADRMTPGTESHLGTANRLLKLMHRKAGSQGDKVRRGGIRQCEVRGPRGSGSPVRGGSLRAPSGGINHRLRSSLTLAPSTHGQAMTTHDSSPPFRFFSHCPSSSWRGMPASAECAEPLGTGPTTANFPKCVVLRS